MIGRRLSHFLVIAPLGAGGMGVVYRARDLNLEREVALKVLPDGALADETARRRFRQEALALSRLNHPHIATIHDFGTQEGVDFLVMELVEGAPLDERLAGGALPESEVRALGAQVADALEAAHEQGIIHRDLKPANVVVSTRGQVKVLDFGLARLTRPREGIDLTRSLTEAEVAAGTVPYMAPEQLLGKPLDARADLYALGVVLYELACGRSPYHEKLPSALIYEIVHQPVVPPRRARPEISPQLEAIIMRCLEKDPQLRYGSARELAADLREPSRSIAIATRRGVKSPHPIVPRGAGLAAGALALALAIVTIGNPGGLRDRLLFGAHAGAIRALAVLPLENLSRDPDQEYFAEGMTDELITDLAQVGALRVISRTSVMRFRDTRLSVPEIARALHVDAIVEGTVQRAGDHVRISAQLIRAATDEHLWAQSFDRDMRDVLALQSDMARAITERIKVRLTPGQARRLAETRQVDPEAYQSCLRGRYAWTQYTREGFDQSYRLFRHAIEIDPAYASAYAGLADAYYGSSSIFLAPNEAIPQARAAAEKALALDSTLAPAHTSLGIVKMVYDLDWPGAEREFRRSLELQPNDANAHLWLGHLLVCRGQFDAGLAELRRALERDPLSPWIRSNLGWHLYFARRYSESAEVLTAALRTDPNYYMHVFLGLTRGRQGDLVGGVTELEKAVAVNRNNDDEAQLGQVYALAGRRADAERIIAKFLERRRTEFVPAGNIAMIYAALGRREEAFHWLEMAFEDHSEWLIFLGVDPGLDPLRSDPRFAAFLRRAHLTS